MICSSETVIHNDREAKQKRSFSRHIMIYRSFVFVDKAWNEPNQERVRVHSMSLVSDVLPKTRTA